MRPGIGILGRYLAGARARLQHDTGDLMIGKRN
jgi:hypothetical protein